MLPAVLAHHRRVISSMALRALYACPGNGLQRTVALGSWRGRAVGVWRAGGVRAREAAGRHVPLLPASASLLYCLVSAACLWRGGKDVSHVMLLYSSFVGLFLLLLFLLLSFSFRHCGGGCVLCGRDRRRCNTVSAFRPLLLAGTPLRAGVHTPRGKQAVAFFCCYLWRASSILSSVTALARTSACPRDLGSSNRLANSPFWRPYVRAAWICGRRQAATAYSSLLPDLFACPHPLRILAPLFFSGGRMPTPWRISRACVTACEHRWAWRAALYAWGGCGQLFIDGLSCSKTYMVERTCGLRYITDNAGLMAHHDPAQRPGRSRLRIAVSSFGVDIRQFCGSARSVLPGAG